MEDHDSAVVRLDGVFDVPAARRLVAHLETVAAQEHVCIDVSKVVSFHDFGIATLAQALKRTRLLHLQLVGFRMHQLRLFKYFGYDATPLSATPRLRAI